MIGAYSILTINALKLIKQKIKRKLKEDSVLLDSIILLKYSSMNVPIFSCSNYEWFYFLSVAYTNVILQVAEQHLKTWQGIFLIKDSAREGLLLEASAASKT